MRLTPQISGARYDDLKNLTCEIQVRTILQDAWAVVAHHITYKQESDAPKHLHRQLNALAGTFETVDRSFNQLRIDRDIYQTQTKQDIQDGKPINQNINADTLLALLNAKLPDRDKFNPIDGQEFLLRLSEAGVNKLDDLSSAIDKTIMIVPAFEKQFPPISVITGQSCLYNRLGVASIAIALVNEKYLQVSNATVLVKEGLLRLRKEHLK